MRVWFFVPNLIGYTRIVLAFAAFPYSFERPDLFFLFYFLSYFLDALDGYAARLLDQGSQFGAVLDMITDRFCTTVLLLILSHLYKPYFMVYVALIVLDLVSHWIHMNSSFVVGKASHKAISKEENALLRIYYSSRPMLFLLCLANEAALTGLYLNAFQPSQLGFLQIVAPLVKPMLNISVPLAILKQFISVLQLCSACSAIVKADEESMMKKA